MVEMDAPIIMITVSVNNIQPPPLKCISNRPKAKIIDVEIQMAAVAIDFAISFIKIRFVNPFQGYSTIFEQ